MIEDQVVDLLTPIKTLKNLCQILVNSDADSMEAVQACNYLTYTNLFDMVDKSLEEIKSNLTTKKEKKIVKYCQHCGKKVEIFLSDEQYIKYINNNYDISSILSDLSIEDRFLLSNGICYDCFLLIGDDFYEDDSDF